MQKFTFEEVKDKVAAIAPTLPIAYYLRVKTLKVNVDNIAETSYISFDKNGNSQITIAVKNVYDFYKILNTQFEFEETIRMLVYHEVSHAILTDINTLTPKYINQVASTLRSCTSSSINIKYLLNVLEDEFIETILNGYFMGFSFTKFSRNISPFDKKRALNSFENFFFYIVRTHDLDNIIILDAGLKLLDLFIRAYQKRKNAQLHARVIYGLYGLWTQYIAASQPEAQPEAQPENNREEQEEIIKHIIDNKYYQETGVIPANFDFELKARSIIFSKIGGQKPASKNIAYGYSGKLSVKKLLKDFNNEGRVFERNSSNAQAQKSMLNGKILNIWLDNSGSFEHNDFAFNCISEALKHIEKEIPSFTFNVIRMKNGRLSIASDKRSNSVFGNYAIGQFEETLENLKTVYKKTHQDKNAKIIDIVLFDGQEVYARTNLLHKTPVSILKPYFNNNQTIMIVEKSNVEPLTKSLKQVKRIICENVNYALRLKENILESMRVLF